MVSGRALARRALGIVVGVAGAIRRPGWRPLRRCRIPSRGSVGREAGYVWTLPAGPRRLGRLRSGADSTVMRRVFGDRGPVLQQEAASRSVSEPPAGARATEQGHGAVQTAVPRAGASGRVDMAGDRLQPRVRRTRRRRRRRRRQRRRERTACRARLTARHAAGGCGRPAAAARETGHTGVCHGGGADACCGGLSKPGGGGCSPSSSSAARRRRQGGAGMAAPGEDDAAAVGGRRGDAALRRVGAALAQGAGRQAATELAALPGSWYDADRLYQEVQASARPVDGPTCDSGCAAAGLANRGRASASAGACGLRPVRVHG